MNSLQAFEMRGEMQPFSQHSSTSATWPPRVPTASIWSTGQQVNHLAAYVSYIQLQGFPVYKELPVH